MAKNTRRRRFNLRRVKITPELNLGTLASDTALVVGATGASTATYRCMSLKTTWNLQNLTASEGPITVGYAHSDYSVAEIKECLESAGAIDVGDKIAQERANRLVRIVGSLDAEESSLKNGQPVSTKLNWLIPIGKFVNVFAFNESTATLTTGSSLKVAGDMWVKD